MRSIFGRCIAIAMMAAIALAWHSPPAQAQTLLMQTAARRAAEDAAEERSLMLLGCLAAGQLRRLLRRLPKGLRKLLRAAKEAAEALDAALS